MGEENEGEKQEKRISLDYNIKKELKEKKKQEKFTKTNIEVNENKHTISFKGKQGKYKFNFLQRNILLALLGMPVNISEVKDIIDQPQNIMDNNFSKLQNYGLIDNIAQMQKKKLRGDTHIQMYWMLTNVGQDVALALLEFFNEEEKNKTKASET